MQHTAVYIQDFASEEITTSQEADLKRWTETYADGRPTIWYTDEFKGKAKSLPAWNRLEAEINSGKISTILVWRLDRLGSPANELTALFEKLIVKKVNLISVKDELALSTTGLLIAKAFASMAVYKMR